jgi:membrane protein DedA with SNARE-associated domain
MQQTFATFVEHYGYFAVLLLIMGEDFGLPLPGETALVVSAAAAATGRLNIWGVLAAAVIGAIIGDNIGYFIGRRGGRPLVLRVGSRVGITHERLAYAEGFFTKYGDGIIVGARFVEILRQLNGIVAGLLGMEWPQFLAFNALGATLWVGVWGAVGYFAGEHVDQIHATVLRFHRGLILTGVVVCIVAVVVYMLRRRKSA